LFLFKIGELQMHRLVNDILGKPQCSDTVCSVWYRYEYPAAPTWLTMAHIVAGLRLKQMDLLNQLGTDRSEARLSIDPAGRCLH